MNAQQLRNAILQEAIHGRLVPQDPNDEPASILLDRIRQEKAKLYKQGKLKKKDLEEKAITEEEKPFEIPKSWVWVRWGMLSESIQYGYNAPAKEKGRIKMVRISDIQNGKIVWETTPFCDIDEKGIEDYKLKKNDLLFARTGGTVGKSYLVSEETQEAIYAGYLIRTRYSSLLCAKYLKQFMESPLYWNQLNDGTTATAQPNCNGQKLAKIILPLPPIAEQQRIVAKIEELMPMVEEYGKAQEALDKLNKELPEQLKKSILQEAIQGRLVPQDTNDEPASVLLDHIRKEKAKLYKQGKLKKNDLEEIPITEEEKPFEIPNGWEWVRLKDITIYISRGRSPVYAELRKFPIVAQKCNQWSGFSLEKAKFADPKTINKYSEERQLQDGDLLWNSTGLGTLGRMAIYDSGQNPYGWAVADSHVTVIRTTPYFSYYKYLFYYFASPEVQTVIEDKSDGSTKQKELSQETVRQYEIPLPPLAEQQRIVAKIEQLFNEIDKLKA